MDAKSEFAARMRDIAPFHVMEVQTAARGLEAAGRSVIHMEIGEPDFPTPQPVLDAALAGIAGGGVYYTSALGLSELRCSIARHYLERYGVEVSPERIVVTAGSSAALLLTLALLVNRDDQILLSDPGYPCNRHIIRTLEGEALAVHVGPDSRYQLTAALIERHWTPRTRGVLIASPSNPTGTTVSWNELERFALEALQATGVAFTPGIDFGRHRPETHVRLAYTIARPLLEEGVRRLARWLPGLASR